MNNRILQVLAVALTALALSVPAVAQPLMETLFQNPEFVKMLELTPEQITGLQKVQRDTEKLLKEAAELAEVLFEQAQTHEEMARIEIDIKRRMATYVSESQTKIDEILQPEQRKKYTEIGFQLSGGLNSPGQSNEWSLGFLDLTDPQKEQIRKLTQECIAKEKALSEELVGLDTRQRPQRRSMATKKILAEHFEQIKSLLTAEQRAKAEKLTAEAPALREKLGLPPPPPRVPTAER